MKKLVKTLDRIERVDQLIRMKATGSPRELAKRLNISESSLYGFIASMKQMGAPIFYCQTRKSYCYKGDVKFTYGFQDINVKK